MSDEDTTQDAPEAPEADEQESTQDEATDSPEETDKDDAWDPERAKRKIGKVNSENKALRERATKAEKKAESVDELQTQTQTLGSENLRLRVGYELGLPMSLALRLQGGTREEMLEDAKAARRAGGALEAPDHAEAHGGAARRSASRTRSRRRPTPARSRSACSAVETSAQPRHVVWRGRTRPLRRSDMANDLYTATQAARSTLAALRYLTTLPRTVRQDFSSEFVAGRGRTVDVKTPISVGDARNYTDANRTARDAIVFDDITESTVPVTMDAQVYKAVRLPDDFATFTLTSLESQVLRPQAESVVDGLTAPLISEFDAVVTDASIPLLAADGSNAIAVLIAARQVLNARKVPMSDATTSP